MSHIATILHNIAIDDDGRHPGLCGYQHGQPMAVVFRAELPDELTGTRACEALFHEFNVGEGNPAADAYFIEHGLRSLSVGDAVEVDGTYFLCRSFGWGRCEQEPVIALAARPKAHPLRGHAAAATDSIDERTSL